MVSRVGTWTNNFKQKFKIVMSILEKKGMTGIMLIFDNDVNIYFLQRT